MDEFHIVTINHHIAFLVQIRRIPNTETMFVSGRPEQVLRRVLVLVDLDERLRNCVDGDSLWICEHVLLPSSYVLQYCSILYRVTANEARMLI